MKTKFGFKFTLNDYSISELAALYDSRTCDRGEDEYSAFIESVQLGRVKPSTMVDVDLLAQFGADVSNRWSIDSEYSSYEEPAIYRGCRMWAGYACKIRDAVRMYTDRDHVAQCVRMMDVELRDFAGGAK